MSPISTTRGTGPALLDVGQVAGLLQCSTVHVYRLRDAGKLPRPIKIGRLLRWRRDDLLDWLQAGCPPQRVAHSAASDTSRRPTG